MPFTLNLGLVAEEVECYFQLQFNTNGSMNDGGFRIHQTGEPYHGRWRTDWSEWQGRANMALTTPRDGTHRFAPQLRRIVDVMELTELHATDADLAGDSYVRGDLRRTA